MPEFIARTCGACGVVQLLDESANAPQTQPCGTCGVVNRFTSSGTVTATAAEGDAPAEEADAGDTGDNDKYRV